MLGPCLSSLTQNGAPLIGPFAPGASGNVATDDVVMMCEQMGFDTGIDLKKMMAASNLAATLTNSNAAGRAKPWLERHLIAKAS